MINEFEKKFVKKIDKIVDKRVSIDGKIEYLLKWKGFSDYNNTWELVEHISNSDLIKEFEKQFVKKIDESVDKRVSNDEKIEYLKIDKIVDKRVSNGQIEYLLKWKGYSDKDNTWRSKKYIEDVIKAVLLILV